MPQFLQFFFIKCEAIDRDSIIGTAVGTFLRRLDHCHIKKRQIMCGALPSSHILLPTPSNSGPCKKKRRETKEGRNEKQKARKATPMWGYLTTL
jgi:hypothetical protein